MLLYNIYLLVQASSFLVCILLYRSLKNTPFKYFLPFLFITLTVELIGYYLITKGLRNYTLFNFFTTLEFIFYSFLFSKHLKTTFFKKLTIGFIPFYAFMVFLNLQFVQGYNNFHTYTFLLGSFFVVLFCCLFFYESVLPEHLDHPLAKQPFFWVCTGLLLFYMGSVIINALFEYLRSYDLQQEGKKIYGIINQSLNVVLYSAFIYAFILCRKTKKTYSSQ